MIINYYPGYYSHRTIPARPGSKQAYLLQPLDVRRHHKFYVDDYKWTVGLERIMKKRPSAVVEHLTLEREQMRKDFVFKVFGLLSCQLFYILINLLVFTSLDTFRFLFEGDVIFMYAFFGAAGIIFLLLLLCKELRKKRLINFFLLSFMVAFLALGLSAFVCFFESYVCVFIVGILYSVVTFVTVLAKFGPCDVAGCSMICCVLGVVFCIYGVVASLVILLTGIGLLTLGIAGIAVTIISVYLMFDTQAMLENKSLKISSSEFVRDLAQSRYLSFHKIFRIIPTIVS
ncbi:unnamed protein product, partial [Nezara viridula]